MLISRHAAERWIERIDPTATIAKAEAAMMKHEAILTLAMMFGASAVKLGCGAKLILSGNCVVTVIGKGR